MFITSGLFQDPMIRFDLNIISPPRNRGGVIFLLKFVFGVCVCVCVCVSVCMCGMYVCVCVREQNSSLRNVACRRLRYALGRFASKNLSNW